MTFEYWCKLNEYIARNEALYWGKLRTGSVGISGTDYEPPVPAEEQTRAEFDAIMTADTTATTKALEAFVWGFGLWWLCYWYLWPLLAIPAVLLRKNRSAFLWAVLAAIHGLTFGAFCSIPYLFIGGWELALSYWVSGLSFDLIHCGGNFVLTLTLFKPLYRVMDKLMEMHKAR